MANLAQVDILIPVYNEAENICQALEGISENVKVPYKIHVLYDFDEDNTLEPAQRFSEKSGIKINFLRNKYGRGVLNALKTGFEETDSDWIVVTMADLSDPPSVINDMFALANSDNLDLVCGSRYMKGGQQIGGPFLKSLLSRAAGWSLNKLTKIPTLDVTNNFKLYSRRVLEDVRIESTGGFEVAMEITVKAFLKGYAIGEVPTIWRDRSAGESKFMFSKWLPKYLKWYFRGFGRREAQTPQSNRI
ncbi:MAG: glycosyltransferase [Bdellovibrionales bacterium]|nr:glycosyltransferase [Bdellovibrionales bacterium]